MSQILFTLSLGLLSACGSTNLAPVVDRAGLNASVKSSVSADPAKERDERGSYRVKKGDTLIRIALEHGQSYRDLVAWNNLADPNDIKVDQMLRVQSPDAGTTGSGVQTSAVTMPPSESRPSTPAIVRKAPARVEKRDLADAPRLDSTAPGKAQDRNGDGVPDAPLVVAKVAPAMVADDDKIHWMWPSEGKVIATFDEGKNKGIDIAGKAGQHVMAAGSGKVMYAGSGIRGYGNLVIVKHSNSLLSAYAHNRTILVKEGQSVNRGQMIAEMGNSDSDGVKLHFEIRQQGKPVDPSIFLPNR